MASNIQFKMNNLTVDIYGVGGNMDYIEWKNLDPVCYVFQVTNRTNGAKYNHYLWPTTTTRRAPGFRKTRTDETYATFQGAFLPAPGENPYT